MNENIIKFNLSKSNIPTLTESGCGMTNTGEARIIANNKGNEKKAIYVFTKGHRSCADHAIIPIQKDDIIVEAYRQRDNYLIQLNQIQSINIPKEEVKVREICTWNSEKNAQIPSKCLPFKRAINAAIEKTNIYHANTPIYIKK